MKPFLLVFNGSVGTAAYVQEKLDNMPQIGYWYRCFEHAIIVTWPSTAHELATALEAQIAPLSGGKRFMVVEIDPFKSQGRMPKEGWYTVNNPSAPRMP